ncbi:hypothetical protein QBC45DRAFT_428649 [Copromyces sp. CBS 386.78]|nr:hypothetical protein QBC45DRAFT_428649 [Copromyces sp. CBS 386.78]
MTNNTDNTNSHVRVPNPPPWLVILHDQLALAHNQIRGIALAVGNKHTQELTTLKEQYEVLRKNYNIVTTLCEAGFEASQNTVARLEQQVQQASSRFASEVWTAIAKYGKKDWHAALSQSTRLQRCWRLRRQCVASQPPWL